MSPSFFEIIILLHYLKKKFLLYKFYNKCFYPVYDKKKKLARRDNN